jgi:type IV pilus assembly protein PilE
MPQTNGATWRPLPARILIMLTSPPKLHRAAAKRGFTLIEVMIVVAIIAIIAAVALPSYFDSIRKARRADAYNAITKAQQAQERFRANNTSYGAGFINVTAATFAASSPGSNATFDSADGYYTVDVTANSDTGYTLAAFAKPGTSQVKDSNCQCLQIQVAGGSITYSAAGTSGSFNGTLAGCGTFASAGTASRCWRR